MAGAYVKVGSGDHHVLALHGWFGSALGWGHFPEYLNTTDFSYVFTDLRGYGSRKGASSTVYCGVWTRAIRELFR